MRIAEENALFHVGLLNCGIEVAHVMRETEIVDPVRINPTLAEAAELHLRQRGTYLR